MRIATSQGGERLAFAVAIEYAVGLPTGQASSATATPLQGLNRLMGGTSTSDVMREQAALAYRKTLAYVASGSSGLDTFWDNYASSCVASGTRTGDRS